LFPAFYWANITKWSILVNRKVFLQRPYLLT
jgi:hypothetical protein